MIPTEYEKYEKTVMVSVANFNPVWGDKAATLEKIKKAVTEAAQTGSKIIAFPELALSGYECGEEARRNHKQCSMHRELAETIPGPSTLELAKLTKQLDIYIILGMPEQDETDHEILYNSVSVVGPEGILGKYRKLHIAPLPRWTEEVCFKRGNELPLFETKYGPIGVQICADFWVVPELSRILRLKGARLLFNCTAAQTSPSRAESMTQITACRSRENAIYAASANLVGTERTLSYHGHSTIVGPGYPSDTQVFVQGGEQEEIVTATLSFESLHESWSIADVKKLRHSELILNEFSKLEGK